MLGCRSADAFQKALRADHVRQAVSVCEMLDRVQQQREQHASETRADAGEQGDRGDCRKQTVFTAHRHGSA